MAPLPDKHRAAASIDRNHDHRLRRLDDRMVAGRSVGPAQAVTPQAITAAFSQQLAPKPLVRLAAAVLETAQEGGDSAAATAPAAAATWRGSAP